MDALETVLKFVQTIPPGTVMSYKDVGRMVGATARQVGRFLSHCDDERFLKVPWWRVTAWDGTFPVAKRDPVLAQIQRDRLLEESVPFKSEFQVDMNRANRWTEELPTEELP